jgi:hypothetical protein
MTELIRQYEREIWLLKKDLEFWRSSVNVNIIIKQSAKIKELEAKIKELQNVGKSQQ